MNKKIKSYDKVDFIFRLLEIVLIPLMVIVFSYYADKYLQRTQENDLKIRVYTELMSNREQAESLLRKDMFNSVINSFLNKNDKTNKMISEELLNLELLAYNFHESLDLKPLFIYLRSKIIQSKTISNKDYCLSQLESIAERIIFKQTPLIESVGKKFDRLIDLEELNNSKDGLEIEGDTLELDGIKRRFTIYAVETDIETKEIKIQLGTKKIPSGSEELTELWISFFDFPSIHNIRLSNDQRCSIILKEFDKKAMGATFTLVYFPGDYAALKEKPFYEEIRKKLIK